MYEGAAVGPNDVDVPNPYDGYAPMAQFFPEAFQWHGVKRCDAFAFYAGDISVEGPHPFCSSGGNLGTGRTHTAMYTDSIDQLRGTAGQGSGRDGAGGIHHARVGHQEPFPPPHHKRIDVQLCQVPFTVHGGVRHAHQGIRERLEVRRRPSAKALEQPGSLTSAIIACGSERVIGELRQRRLALP
jgi:hypothetical protein